MGDEMSSVAVPAPHVTINRNPGAQLALALTVFALVLASNSIINQSWLNYSEEFPEETGSLDMDYGLTGFDVELCDRSDCETNDDSYSDTYDDDCEDSDSDACSDIKDFHNGGFVAVIMLIISSVILFVATIFQTLSMLGKLRKTSNIISSIGGILVGTSVLVWFLMIPDTIPSFTSDVDIGWENLGQGFWMALVASSAGLGAGFSGKIQSWIDGPPRTRSQGVRAGLEMNEFVLKESSCGNHSLSILADSNLIRVVRIDRIGASASINDVLATRRDSYTGFSHQRLDWLDDFKGLWWVLSGASLISTFMISSLFLIPFTIAALLVILQLMDPERFVVSTNSGNHPFYINRWRSNRELTNLAMDLVDGTMIALLRGEELNTEELDTRADLIAERFTAEQEFMRAKEQAKAEEKQVRMNAANQMMMQPPVQDPSMQHQAMMQQPTPGAPMMDSVSNEDLSTVSEPIGEDNNTEAAQEEPEAAQEEEEAIQEEETVEPEAAQEEEETPEPEEVVTIPAPPPLPTTPPPQNPPPGAMGMPTTPPPQNPPPGAMGMPSTPPPQSPPPGAMGMPTTPPPQSPPPGAMGMPTPPGMPAPPGAMGIPVPLGMPAPPGMANPPPVIVQASPREENLSDDEKDDLLGDLSA